MRLMGFAASAAADAVCSLLDGGWLEIMDGETLLVRLRFAAPAFQPAVNGTATANRIKDGIGARSGIAKRYRAVSFSNQTVFEGPASELDIGGSPVEEGAPVSVKEFKYTQPREATE